MEELSSFEKTIKGIINVLFKKKYGVKGVIIGSLVLLFIIIITLSGADLLFTNKEQVKQQDALGVALTPDPLTQAVPLPSTVSPTISLCDQTEFSEDYWNVSFFYKNEDGFYLPSNDASHKYLYPFITYKNKIPAVFKKVDISYIAMYQDKSSTTSATLYMALIDDHKNQVFELNIPQPNRQIIGLKKIDNTQDVALITPKAGKPIILPHKIAYNSTHNIIITTKKYNETDNTVTYVIQGSFIDTNGNQQNIYREEHVKLITTDPYIKEYTLTVGTGRKGQIKIKKILICAA